MPEESTHCELSFVGQVAMSWETVLEEKAVELPFRHVLVVHLRISGIVKWHLKEVVSSLFLLIVLHF